MKPLEERLPTSLSQELVEAVPYALARRESLLPLRFKGEGLLVACADALNVEALDALSMRIGAPVEAFLCSEDELVSALDVCYGQNASTILADLDQDQGESGETEVYDLLDMEEAAPVVQLLNLILTEAIRQGASDIHFEPEEMELRVRYRIDGALQAHHLPQREHRLQLLTRIKVMAGLDIAEHRLPQDGRIRLRLGKRAIDFRASTLPTAHGERIVLRILDKGNVVLGLDHIGMPSNMVATLRELIALPEGIVLVMGPTGSGKTTTLYSALTELSSDAINIMTVEDPVEYKLAGIAQIGVRPKISLTFASCLRHILRQDPDVIMVGEIRDAETAQIAIQAALTGHFVLSTLHTNDAPSALTRLVDMGIEPYLLASSVVGVLAQRLVRRTCSHCHGEGCGRCCKSGYRGRCGLFELMIVDEAVRRQVVASAEASLLREVSRARGLAAHGEELIAAGLTTREEVLRATRSADEVMI